MTKENFNRKICFYRIKILNRTLSTPPPPLFTNLCKTGMLHWTCIILVFKYVCLSLCNCECPWWFMHMCLYGCIFTDRFRMEMHMRDFSNRFTQRNSLSMLPKPNMKSFCTILRNLFNFTIHFWFSFYYQKLKFHIGLKRFFLWKIYC